MSNILDGAMRKAAGTTDGVQIPVFFSQFFDIYDQSWYLIESTEADSSSCKTAFCQTQIDAGGTIVGYSYAITTADADGNITGYIYETTSSDANGTYFSSNHYDANWNLTESTYSDGTSTWVSTYQTDTDADGNVTGYTYATTYTDLNGTYVWSNHYDASGNLTESSYTDGNYSSTSTYETTTDADGNVTGYIHETTSSDANGTYFSSNHYDANWNLTESTYSDGTSTWVSTYQIVTDENSNITGYIYETTQTDANGTYFSSNHYDANWNLTKSTYTDGSKISTAEIEDIICYVCSDPCCTEISSEEMVVPNEDVTLVGVSEYNQIDLLLI